MPFYTEPGLQVSEEVKKLMHIFIINKFRGDQEICKPGLQEMEELTVFRWWGFTSHASLSLVWKKIASRGNRVVKTAFPA